jgi:hypothetical protein
MHFGFTIGTPSLAEVLRKAAAPVTVEVLTPTHPFDRRQGIGRELRLEGQAVSQSPTTLPSLSLK